MSRSAGLTIGIVVGSLLLGSAAIADPFDPDPSFGGDGVVRISGSDHVDFFREEVVETSGRRIYVSGGAAGAGSGESGLSVRLFSRNGHYLKSNGGRLEQTSSYPRIADVLLWRHRVFVVGWLEDGYNWEHDKAKPDYGFAVAFRGSVGKGGVRWGPESFYDRYWGHSKRGVQRLKEFNFGAVTAGAVDAHGRVLIAGRIGGRAAVVRLTRDGRIDSGYGHNGVASIPIGSGSSSRDIAVRGSAALVVGNARVKGHEQGFSAKLKPSGLLDRNFSFDGVRFIGRPGSFVPAVERAEAGRWLIAYEAGRRAGVTKLGANGALTSSFGRHGRASIRATRPHQHHVIDALAIDRKEGRVHRIILMTSAERGDQLRRLGTIWRRGGKPVGSLPPDGTARLPWHLRTIDTTVGWRHQLVALIPDRLVRMQ